MHFLAQPTGATSAQRKIHLATDLSATYGGNKIMDSSVYVVYSCGISSPIPIEPQYLCDQFNSSESIISFEDMIVYPNPSSDELHFDFTSRTEGITEINLINLYGEKLFSIKPSEIHSGKNTFVFHLNDYPTGIYFIMGKINGKYFNSKVIHLNPE